MVRQSQRLPDLDRCFAGFQVSLMPKSFNPSTFYASDPPSPGTGGEWGRKCKCLNEAKSRGREFGRLGDDVREKTTPKEDSEKVGFTLVRVEFDLFFFGGGCFLDVLSASMKYRDWIILEDAMGMGQKWGTTIECRYWKMTRSCDFRSQILTHFPIYPAPLED